MGYGFVTALFIGFVVGAWRLGGRFANRNAKPS